MSYTYDALARLKTAVTTGSAAYPQWGLEWSYDRYGKPHGADGHCRQRAHELAQRGR